MASGQLFPFVITLPATLAAIPDYVVGGSTPAENVPVFSYADAAAAYIDLHGRLQGYGGGGLTLKGAMSCASVITNSAVIQAAIRRIADDAEDMDSAHTYDFNTVTVAAPSALNENKYWSIGFTSGADMDSLAEGETFILRILRDPAHGSDNLADTMHIWPSSLVLMET